MMTLKPKDRFKLKQMDPNSIFKGLELLVHYNGPTFAEVKVEGNKIIIEVKEKQDVTGNA